MEYKIRDLTDENIKNLLGVNDKNLKLLATLYECDIVYRNDVFNMLTNDNEKINKFNNQMDYLINNVNDILIDENFIKQSFIDNVNIKYSSEIIGYSNNGKPFKCKTYNQHLFVHSIYQNDLVFSVGPAGTGKTFLAVLLACQALKRGDVNKIIITRPAVEAGESLGFLPGDLKEKINPYLMPIYDALDIILGQEQKEKFIEKGIIEIIPLAYMRGRTLNEAFVILDEAQNTTEKQMLMFLTRLGFNSKMLINGDVTQIDLNISRNKSGLVVAIEKLKNIKKIAIIEFKTNDVVRNPLVQEIIDKFKVD